MARFVWFCVSLVCCCVLLVGQANAKVVVDQSLVKQWIQNVRPGMLAYLEKKVLEAEERRHNGPDKYFNRDLSMLDVIRMYVTEHGADIDADMMELLRRLPETGHGENGAKAADDPWTCQYTPQCPPEPATDSEKLTNDWHKVVKAMQDPSSCQPCQTLVEFLQETACSTAWETMRDNIIDFCEDVLFPIIDLDPVMCNGSVTLQGQHLYCIVKEVSPFEFCESMNLCYPVETATAKSAAPVRERTPWALKDKLQPKLQEQIADRQKQRQKEQAAGVVTIVQLTDIHVQSKYVIGAPTDCKAAICCLEDSLPRDGTTDARMWGEYSCNVPERTVIKFLERVPDFDPDFVIYAGDSPPHTLWEETLDSQLNCSNRVASAMRNTFPAGMTVYPGIGNHEMYPTNLYSFRLTETAQMSQAFTTMWQDLAKFDAEAISTFSDMSYYTMLNRPGLRVMAVNSNYDWYTANFFNSVNKNDSSNADHMAWVQSTLQQARENNEKVVVITHHPVHSGSIRSIRWWQQLALEYSDVIVLHASGHTHNDELDLIVDPDTDECKGVNLVAPTITTNTNINPSLRVFHLDNTTFELLDSEVYHFELDKQNPDNDPEIVLSYNTMEEYGMTDLSPASWQDLVLRFIDDEALFQTYYNNRRSQAPDGPCALDNVCGDSCKTNTICDIWFPSPDDSAECVNSWNYTMSAQ